MCAACVTDVTSREGETRQAPHAGFGRSSARNLVRFIKALGFATREEIDNDMWVVRLGVVL